MSYRSSYTPWKSSLPSSYKTSPPNAYSLRDDISSSTSRYSALASPSSYRPSFSMGTYRLKRDTPIVPDSSYINRYSASSSSVAAVPKPDINISDTFNSKTGKLKRYGSTSSNLGKYSREVSPAALEHTNRIKSRDPSPAPRTLRGKSRDPSPALGTKCKINYGSSANSYRLDVPKSTTTLAYGTRYGSSAGVKTPVINNTSATSISYLSASDFKARSLSRAKEEATRKSNEKELQILEAEEDKADAAQSLIDVMAAAPIAYSDEEEQEHNNVNGDNDEDDKVEHFVSVAVCTRATSPTPPGAVTATTVHRARRIDIAKTIEKTIQRSTKRKKMLEKEIQSDRLDDSTRYSRFGLSSRVSTSYSPHTDRYSTTNLRYSHSPLSTSSKSSVTVSSPAESKKDDNTNSAITLSNKLSKTALNNKLKLSPPKSIKINSRQSSVENLSAQKPPAAPKGDSPTKSSLSSTTSLSSKLPNKDFRKSALNVGPTDRPRKSRTPSTGTDSDLNTVEALNGALQAIQRLERSPSAGSEISNTSTRSIRRTNADSKLRPKGHNKIMSSGLLSSSSPKSPLNRTNSNANSKTKSCNSSSNSTTPSSAESTSGSAINTTISASSGTESCTENKKSIKKIINKKKLTKDVSSTTTTSTKSSLDNNLSPPPQIQPLAVAVSKGKKSDSSTSRATPKTFSDKDPLKRLKKLSSVSNFLAAQQQENSNSDEQIYLESSDNSTSLSKKSVSLTQANETKTTPSPVAKTKNYISTCNTKTNSINELNNITTTTKSSKSTSALKTKSKTKSKTKIKSTTNSITNTSPTNTSTSYCPQDTTTVNESSRMPSELQTESLSTCTSTNPTNNIPITTSTITTSSASGTDQEDSSWWQDTSRQIDTASALDCNLKDEMRFKIRHIDSGETAWWLRNDEDDTLADDDLKTLNQEEELGDEELDHDEEATDHLISSNSDDAEKLNEQRGWCINEINDFKKPTNEHELDHEPNYRKSESLDDLNNHTSTNGYCYEKEENETIAKLFPRSRLTPETDWWNNENETELVPSPISDNPSKTNSYSLGDKSSKQNVSIQLKICRVESGEKPWWLQEETPTQEAQPNESGLTVEATIALPKKNKTKSDSSSSNSEPKTWWMSDPTKKLFNIQRVESGEKAWWQDETKSDSNEFKPKVLRRNSSQEQEWWLDDIDDRVKNQANLQQDHVKNGYHTQFKSIRKGNDEPIRQQGHQNFNNRSQSQNNLIALQDELSDSFNFDYSERPPPLGQCASPVQTEEQTLMLPVSQQQQPCNLSYDNIRMTKVKTAAQQPILEIPTNYMTGPTYQQEVVFLNQSPVLQQSSQKQQSQQEKLQNFPTQRQQQNYLRPPLSLSNAQYNNNDLRSRNVELFISHHKNIDELLGGTCTPISPLFYDNDSTQIMPLQPRNMLLEEITPDQVRIHDSTAQMPIIQRMERDDWQLDSLSTTKAITPPRFGQRKLHM